MSGDLDSRISALERQAEELRKLIARDTRAKTAAQQRARRATDRADRLDEEIAQLRSQLDAAAT